MQSYWNPENAYAATVFFHNQTLHDILYCSVARSSLSNNSQYCHLYCTTFSNKKKLSLIILNGAVCIFKKKYDFSYPKPLLQVLNDCLQCFIRIFCI